MINLTIVNTINYSENNHYHVRALLIGDSLTILIIVLIILNVIIGCIVDRTQKKRKSCRLIIEDNFSDRYIIIQYSKVSSNIYIKKFFLITNTTLSP